MANAAIEIEERAAKPGQLSDCYRTRERQLTVGELPWKMTVKEKNGD